MGVIHHESFAFVIDCFIESTQEHATGIVTLCVLLGLNLIYFYNYYPLLCFRLLEFYWWITVTHGFSYSGL